MPFHRGQRNSKDRECFAMMQKYEEETLYLNWVNKSIFTWRKIYVWKTWVKLCTIISKILQSTAETEMSLKRQQMHTLFTERLLLQFHKVAMVFKMLLWNAWLKRAVNHSIPSVAAYHIYKSNLDLIITGVWDNKEQCKSSKRSL